MLSFVTFLFYEYILLIFPRPRCGLQFIPVLTFPGAGNVFFHSPSFSIRLFLFFNYREFRLLHLIHSYFLHLQSSRRRPRKGNHRPGNRIGRGSSQHERPSRRVHANAGRWMVRFACQRRRICHTAVREVSLQGAEPHRHHPLERGAYGAGVGPRARGSRTRPFVVPSVFCPAPNLAPFRT